MTARSMGTNLDPVHAQQLVDVAARSTTTGMYPTDTAPSPDMVDMRALASIFDPENEACRLPTRGSARRTATIRIPFKLNVITGTTGVFRAGICPMAFGSTDVY